MSTLILTNVYNNRFVEFLLLNILNQYFSSISYKTFSLSPQFNNNLLFVLIDGLTLFLINKIWSIIIYFVKFLTDDTLLINVHNLSHNILCINVSNCWLNRERSYILIIIRDSFFLQYEMHLSYAIFIKSTPFILFTHFYSLRT